MYMSMTDEDAAAAECDGYDEDKGRAPTADEDVGVPGLDRTNEFSCASHQAYVTSGNQKKVLFTLCIGLSLSDTEKDTPLFSFL